MLDPNSWVEPTIEWSSPLDAPALRDRLSRQGELLTTWPAAPFETTPTNCFRLEDRYWLFQFGVGSVSFDTSAPCLSAFPFADSDPDWFRQIIKRSWLPAIYPFWGRQVIHASAVAAMDAGHVVAFTGPTHAGKSTTAYGLGLLDGWRLLADDTLAFSSSSKRADREIQVHPLRNDIRLRQASADYFATDAQTTERIDWPAGNLSLRAIYVLDGGAEFPPAVEFTRLRTAEGLPLLLQQAYALSFEIPTYNQKLMRDYAQLAASVPMFRLRYQRSFSAADGLFGALEAHIAAHVDLIARRNSTQPYA
jgi:hypothetical protein